MNQVNEIDEYVSVFIFFRWLLINFFKSFSKILDV